MLPWNDVDAVARARSSEHGERRRRRDHGADDAQRGRDRARRPATSKAWRELCTRKAGALLIFDEVITGFRLALGGAAERFGVTPDLAIYGKAHGRRLAGRGAGRPGRLMERFGTGEVNHSGTFNANVMAAAADVATLETLRDDPPYERIERVGERADGRAPGTRGATHGAAARAGSARWPSTRRSATGTRSSTSARSSELDAERYGRSSPERLVDAGVWVASRGIWYVSAAHGRRELDVTLERAAGAVADA